MTTLAAAPTSPIRPPAASWASHANVAAKAPCLLLVDDDRILRIMAQETLSQLGYDTRVAANGEEALKLLRAAPGTVDTIILDREMTGISGLEMMALLKADPALAGIPVILLTGSGEPEKVQEGIEAGAFYYLVKPIQGTLLRSIIEAALRERQQKQALVAELSRHSAALKAMTSCKIIVRSLAEAEDAASFLASVFPEPERVVVGLMELLVNAVEHGNLGITFHDKEQLLADNNWRQEIERRATLPEHSDKTVEVIYQSNPDAHLVQITDGGQGFDWKQYWHINPSRAGLSHGRGIARARTTAFDRMAYNQSGNSVTVMVGKQPAGAAAYAW